MPKLHELLAAEGPLTTQAQTTRKDLENTFEKKRTHFEQRRVTFVPLEEGAQSVVEEQLDLQTTVKKELKWISGILEKAIDAAYQIDEANTEARADIILDNGDTLAKDVPATALLRLEKRSDELLQLIQKIPTMDPSKGFSIDKDSGEGIYVSRVDAKHRTKKTQRPIVLYDATPEHPAQTQLLSEDVPVGRVETIHWSALLTVAQKGDMLDRVEALRVAIKKARSRANSVDVSSEKRIAAKLLDYVFIG